MGGLSTLIGPMTPLFSNPEFPPAVSAFKFIKWNRLENTRVAQTLKEGKLPKLQDMGVKHYNKWLQYHQLNTYIEMLSQQTRIDRPLTKFEQLLIEERKQTRKLSKIYKLLLPIGPPNEIENIRNGNLK